MCRKNVRKRANAKGGKSKVGQAQLKKGIRKRSVRYNSHTRTKSQGVRCKKELDRLRNVSARSQSEGKQYKIGGPREEGGIQIAGRGRKRGKVKNQITGRVKSYHPSHHRSQFQGVPRGSKGKKA